MINKILQSTKGKPCSCPENKLCTGCKAKVIKPRVHLEDPHRLTVPIVFSHYKHKTPTTVNRSTEKRWPLSKKKQRDDTPSRPTALCDWIRKKRALRQLKAEREKERKRERDTLRREREIEFIEQLQRQQKYVEPETKIVLPPTKTVSPPLKALPPPPKALTPSPVVIKTKTVKARGKSTYAKPRAESRYVAVKKYSYHQPLSERFVNYCYRFWCQVYCCLTIILFIGIAIIFFV